MLYLVGLSGLTVDEGIIATKTPKVRQLRTVKNMDTYFFKTFGPVFEREARFSKVQPVPMLGGMDDPKETVESFYEFWYNFDSWRSFEYLDKEVNEGSDRYASYRPISC